ncbi:hypothetical protein [Leuconostoc pseudomesenteroides]|uniref:hypothetical protein n=1 Tax=Leuconostoc pseudomesenteroides TaxID=33968 RepID=UPI002285BD9E|nr:hypothetical protein [Leuconostoc pseudomesenteroides]WAM38191.1 hypothetical protein OYT93_08265 [Leuconostoc pseudomesenteroides]
MEECKVKRTELQYISDNARNIEAIAHALGIAINSKKLDSIYTEDVVDIMLKFAINIVNKVGEIGVEQ